MHVTDMKTSEAHGPVQIVCMLKSRIENGRVKYTYILYMYIVYGKHLYLHVKSMYIVTKATSLIPVRGEVYSIQLYAIKIVSYLLQVDG